MQGKKGGDPAAVRQAYLYPDCQCWVTSVIPWWGLLPGTASAVLFSLAMGLNGTKSELTFYKNAFKSTKSSAFCPDLIPGSLGSINLPWEGGSWQIVLQLPIFAEVLWIWDPPALESWQHSKMKWFFIPTGWRMNWGLRQKTGSPWRREGYTRNYQGSYRKRGQFFPEAEIVCQCMCEVSRQITVDSSVETLAWSTLQDTGMEYFACL